MNKINLTLNKEQVFLCHISFEMVFLLWKKHERRDWQNSNKYFFLSNHIFIWFNIVLLHDDIYIKSGCYGNKSEIRHLHDMTLPNLFPLNLIGHKLNSHARCLRKSITGFVVWFLYMDLLFDNNNKFMS